MELKGQSELKTGPAWSSQLETIFIYLLLPGSTLSLTRQKQN